MSLKRALARQCHSAARRPSIENLTQHAKSLHGLRPPKVASNLGHSAGWGYMGPNMNDSSWRWRQFQMVCRVIASRVITPSLVISVIVSALFVISQIGPLEIFTSGIIVDTDGTPLEGVCLSYSPLPKKMSFFETKTHESGLFYETVRYAHTTYTDLDAQGVYIVFTKKGYEPIRLRLKATGDFKINSDLRVVMRPLPESEPSP